MEDNQKIPAWFWYLMIALVLLALCHPARWAIIGRLLKFIIEVLLS